MPLLAVLILQVASVTVPANSSDGCPQFGDGDAIVVCHQAIRPDQYRLPLRGDHAPIEKTGPPRAEWGLGNGIRMNAHVESGALPQGAISQRAMVSVKVPF